MASVDEPSFGVLVDALVELDRHLADDLLLAVRTYTEAERRLIELDQRAGRDVSHRPERLRRLAYLRASLERELGV